MWRHPLLDSIQGVHLERACRTHVRTYTEATFALPGTPFNSESLPKKPVLHLIKPLAAITSGRKYRDRRTG